jgi:NADH-quinone oxidoreductase subunit I
MKNAIIEIFSGLKSLFIGMKITIGQFFKPTVTVHYPHETLQIPPRFRGHIELVKDPTTGIAKCFVCKLCEKACPSDCITVEGVKPEGAKRKTVTYYRLDFTKCSLCGSCVEACRDGAIRFSREYNLASTNKDDYVMDLFKRLEAEAGTKSEVRSPRSEVGAETAKAEAPKAEAAAAPAKVEAKTKPEVRSLKSEVGAEAAKAEPKAQTAAAPAPVAEPAKVEAK